MAPTRTGNAKTARTPEDSASLAKVGQRRVASVTSRRSSSNTGDPDLTASTHGPSPSVNWRSSINRDRESETKVGSGTPSLEMTASPTPSAFASARHLRQNDSSRAVMRPAGARPADDLERSPTTTVGLRSAAGVPRQRQSSFLGGPGGGPSRGPSATVRRDTVPAEDQRER